MITPNCPVMAIVRLMRPRLFTNMARSSKLSTDMKPCVKVGNKLILRTSVKFIDIEECGITGKDIITFEYKGKIHKSYLFI